ncbi:tryptophanase [Colletotrichum chrysophilum]|uniref:Tryptophanase n=1 Tax=Colletotrichum chrysophilum TaxID=1836956 RepID=A0AAD9E519_9PEZI|nr:tryptophanase [Colletotrichum chrysophilum]
MSPLIAPSHNTIVVRPHIAITPEEREEVLRSVENNVFAFPAALPTCDYLSDSATSAMTDVQWAAMLRGDDSYGRSSGYYCLLEACRDVFLKEVCGRYVNDEIQRLYPNPVSLDRFNRIKDPFFPSGAEAQGTFAGWHSFVAEEGSRPGWKIYLNANAQGESRAPAVVREALNKLCMPQTWAPLEKVLLPGNKLMYLSLDLCPGSQARVKIYVQHRGATAADLSQAASIVAPDIVGASDPEILQVCTVPSGGSEGPYKGKGAMTCFSFTADGGDLKSEVAVYFPVHEYASDDAEIRKRIETYLGTADEKALKTYQRVLDAVAHRPLQDGRGIHAWVGLKMTRSRGSVVTFYLASEMFGVLPKRL